MLIKFWNFIKRKFKFCLSRACVNALRFSHLNRSVTCNFFIPDLVNFESYPCLLVRDSSQIMKRLVFALTESKVHISFLNEKFCSSNRNFISNPTWKRTKGLCVNSIRSQVVESSTTKDWRRCPGEGKPKKMCNSTFWFGVGPVVKAVFSHT